MSIAEQIDTAIKTHGKIKVGCKGDRCIIKPRLFGEGQTDDAYRFVRDLLMENRGVQIEITPA